MHTRLAHAEGAHRHAQLCGNIASRLWAPSMRAGGGRRGERAQRCRRRGIGFERNLRVHVHGCRRSRDLPAARRAGPWRAARRGRGGEGRGEVPARCCGARVPVPGPARGHTEGTSLQRKRGTAPNSAHDLHEPMRAQRATCGHLSRRRLCMHPLLPSPPAPSSERTVPDSFSHELDTVTRIIAHNCISELWPHAA